MPGCSWSRTASAATSRVSAAAYGQALFGGTETPWGEVGGLRADAATVNPLIGGDALEPLVAAAEATRAGVFALVRTSNPGAADVLDLATPDGPLHEHLARMVAERAPRLAGESGLSGMGAVVGATGAGVHGAPARADADLDLPGARRRGPGRQPGRARAGLLRAPRRRCSWPRRGRSRAPRIRRLRPPSSAIGSGRFRKPSPAERERRPRSADDHLRFPPPWRTRAAIASPTSWTARILAPVLLVVVAAAIVLIVSGTMKSDDEQLEVPRAPRLDQRRLPAARRHQGRRQGRLLRRPVGRQLHDDRGSDLRLGGSAPAAQSRPGPVRPAASRTAWTWSTTDARRSRAASAAAGAPRDRPRPARAPRGPERRCGGARRPQRAARACLGARRRRRRRGAGRAPGEELVLDRVDDEADDRLRGPSRARVAPGGRRAAVRRAARPSRCSASRPGSGSRCATCSTACCWSRATTPPRRSPQAAGGTEARFVAADEPAARKLGLDDTSYANPIGLDEPGNYSSAEDLATLAIRLRRDKLLPPDLQHGRDARSRAAPIRATSSTATCSCARCPTSTASRPATRSTPGTCWSAPGRATASSSSPLCSAPRPSPIATRRRCRCSITGSRSITGAPPSARASRCAPSRSTTGTFGCRWRRRATCGSPSRHGQQVETTVRAPGEVDGPVARGERLGQVSVSVDGDVVARAPLAATRAAAAASLLDRYDAAIPGPRAVAWGLRNRRAHAGLRGRPRDLGSPPRSRSRSESA